MKRFLYSVLALLILFSFCQKKENEMQSGQLGSEEGSAISDSTMLTIKPKPINYDSMFVVLFDLAQSIQKNPADTMLRAKLVEAGYDTTWETIMAVGVSAPVDSLAGETLAMRRAEQAARIDAYRWCAYIKRWKDNLNFSDFSKIEADFSGIRVVKTEQLPDNRVAVLIEVKSQLIQ